MGLFGNKQEYVNQHRVPSETEKAIRNLKKRCDDLEEKIESLTRRCNIITAKEAAWRLQQIEEEAMPKELNNTFTAIDNALNNEQDSLILFEYTKEYEDNWCTTYNMVRAYHIKRLAEALRKYGYRVDVYGPEDEYGLRIKIHLRNEEDRLEFSKIDPDKKYLLPMKGSDRFAKKDLDKWIFIGDGRTAEEALHSTYLYHDDTFTVQGKDILDAPDWVKAIKPIEVKE